MKVFKQLEINEIDRYTVMLVMSQYLGDCMSSREMRALERGGFTTQMTDYRKKGIEKIIESFIECEARKLRTKPNLLNIRFINRPFTDKELKRIEAGHKAQKARRKK